MFQVGLKEVVHMEQNFGQEKENTSENILKTSDVFMVLKWQLKISMRKCGCIHAYSCEGFLNNMNTDAMNYSGYNLD